MAKQEIGDLESIRQQLEAWMSKQLDGTQQLILGELIFPEASGESSITLIVEANWTAQGKAESGKFVLRMAPLQSQVFESHDLRMQYTMMQLMRDCDIPAPEMVGYEPDSSLIGSDFYVMKFIAGQIPPDNPPMAFGSWVTELSAEQRAQMWNNGFQTLAKIHQIDIEQYDLSMLPGSAVEDSPVLHEVKKFDSMLALGLRDNADPIIEKAWNILKDNMPASGVRRLCWGDSRVGNIIWDGIEPAAVIDWEMASMGDPLMDIAWWFWVDHCNSVGLGTEKMTGLPEFNDAYRQWHDLTGLPIDNVVYYELFCVVRFAIIMERKFIHLTLQDPNFADLPNHAVQFIQPLMDQRSA